MVGAAFLVAVGMLAWAAAFTTRKVGDMLDSRKQKREEALTVEQKQKLVTAHSTSFHDYGAINEVHKSVETQVRAVTRTCWPSPSILMASGASLPARVAESQQLTWLAGCSAHSTLRSK